MGRVAKWIDTQDAAAKDRIIEHPDPTYSGRDWWSFDHDCGCLVGSAVGQSGAWRVGRALFTGEHLIPVIASPAPSILTEAFKVGERFYGLTYRFGAERVWRAAKARAARGNRVEMPAVTEEAAVA